MDELINNLIGCDRKVRCVMIVDQYGEITKFKQRKNLELILGQDELKDYAKSIIMRKQLRDNWNEKIGETKCVLTIRDKLNILVFYREGLTVIVSIDAFFPLGAIAMVLEIVRNTFRPKKVRKPASRHLFRK